MAEVSLRDSVKRQMIKLLKLTKEYSVNTSIPELELRRESLLAKWAEYQVQHQTVLNRTGVAEIEMQENEYDNAESVYSDAKLRLDSLIKCCRLRHEHKANKSLIMQIIEESRVLKEENSLQTCLNDISKHFDRVKMLSIDRIQTGEKEDRVMADQAAIQSEVFKAKAEISTALTHIETARQAAAADAAAVIAGAAAGNAVQPQQVNIHNHELRLAPISIKKFSGEADTWEEFRDTFKKAIHEREGMSDIVKFQHLKSSVIGEAEEIVRNLPLSDANYTIAWALLLQNYNNKHSLVKTHLMSLFNQTKCKASDVDLRRLINKTSSALQALKNIECPTEHWDTIIIFMTVERIDEESSKLWEQSRALIDDFPKWADLELFLHARVRTLNSLGLNSMSTSRNMSCGKPAKSSTVVKSHQTTTNDAKTKFVCADCSKDHGTQFCYIFRRRCLADRKMLVSAKKLCTNCLGSRHSIESCTVTKRCGKCNLMHHTLLHDPQVPSMSHTNQNTSSSISQDVVVTCTPSTVNRAPVLLSTALVTVQSGSTSVILRALIDCGSQASFITEATAQLLKLSKSRVEVKVSGVGSVQSETSRGSVSVTLLSRIDPTFALPLDALVLRSITSLQSIPSPDITTWEHLRNLKLADPHFHQPEKIDLLLGADVYGSILREGVRIGVAGTPVAQNTVLGWILSGPVSQSSPRCIVSAHCGVIDDQLRKFWELEEIPRQTPLTADEIRCEQHFATTHRRDDDGRYVVRLPLIPEEIELGESYKMASMRLYQMERRFAQNHKFFLAYNEFMNQYISLRHMEPVTGPSKRNDVMYYIPHHAIIKESSTTTKLRVVFDASRKSSNGKSLNEQLHVGPRLQQDLTSIVMRWRKYEVVFTSDIEKMFRQIQVDEQDRDLQRILWRSSVHEPVRTYRLTTVTYGTTSAPYLAIKTLRQLATDESARYPLGSEILLRDAYVDDILSGADNLENALNLQTQLIEMLRSAGFTLRKWASNRDELLTHLPEDFRECALPLQINLDERIKTLGIQWYPATDEFGFVVSMPPSIMPPTKRSLLSDAAKLYDPLGWLAPTIIIAKLMFQHLWTLQLQWDDPLPSDLAERWLQFRSNLHTLSNIRISRWLRTNSCPQNMQIHGFCDASLKAYAAVVYIRVQQPDQTITTSLIVSKTKVAPIKTISLPKLELCGASMLAKLIGTVIESLQVENIPVFTWTDSEIVLAWLRSPPCRWNVFVANRVSDIQSRTPIAHWGHVRSEDNPADCASRGILPFELHDHNLWWSGPIWLRDDTFPARSHIDDTHEEERKTQVCLNILTDEKLSTFSVLTKNTSNWQRLIHITAYCLRFVSILKKRVLPSRDVNLNSTEKIDAKNLLYRQIQLDHFSSEYGILNSNNQIASKNKLSSLCPFVDKHGVMRVGGRLKNATMNFEEKHPIIIPSKSHIGLLLIRDAHMKTLHGGTQLTLGYIQRTHWLLNGRNEVRNYIHKCSRCIRYRASTHDQLMADLPKARVTMSRPFLHTSVDYSGTIMVRSARGRGHHATKAYIAVFICQSTKAIHIELVSDLTAVAFIAAFRRFVARRGICSTIYSDNGTNFVGADLILQKHLQDKDVRQDVSRGVHAIGTTWHFSPPLAPHFNGLAESGIRSVKHHLRRVIGESTLTFEEMTTFLTQVEACLNSRPLYALTNDPTDFSALTPGHFIIGEPLNAIPEPNLLGRNPNLLDRWKLVQRKVQQIWKRWSSEYIHHLQQRNKWRTIKDEVRVGDVVLMKEDNLPPGKWALGVVEETHPGSDGLVRVVTVRSKESSFKRSVVKLIIL